jgi:hypothetical protein
MAEDWTVVGRCPLCGGGGADETENLSEADAAARSTDAVLIPLFLYEGKWVCEWCKNREIKRDNSRKLARETRDEDKFFSKIGVKTEVE